MSVAFCVEFVFLEILNHDFLVIPILEALVIAIGAPFALRPRGSASAHHGFGRCLCGSAGLIDFDFG